MQLHVTARQIAPTITPTCQCKGMSVCTSTSMASFMLRAPRRVHHRTSPWYTYAQTVYQGSPPLPFDVSRLELLYPALLPTQVCTVASHMNEALLRPFVKECTASLCAEWMPKSPPSTAAAKAFAANRTYIRIPAPSDINRGAFGHAVILQSRRRASLGSNTWVEVTRHSDPAEGRNGYGCWLYPAVGSGVWVNTRRLRTWATRRHSWSDLRSNDSAYAAMVAHGGWDAFEILRSHGRAMGWMQMGPTAGSHELVLTDTQCLHGNGDDVGLTSGCIPFHHSRGPRTGWNASNVCRCLAKDGPLSSSTLLNCAATQTTAVYE